MYGWVGLYILLSNLLVDCVISLYGNAMTIWSIITLVVKKRGVMKLKLLKLFKKVFKKNDGKTNSLGKKK